MKHFPYSVCDRLILKVVVNWHEYLRAALPGMHLEVAGRKEPKDGALASTAVPQQNVMMTSKKLSYGSVNADTDRMVQQVIVACVG